MDAVDPYHPATYAPTFILYFDVVTLCQLAIQSRVHEVRPYIGEKEEGLETHGQLLIQ